MLFSPVPGASFHPARSGDIPAIPEPAPERAAASRNQSLIISIPRMKVNRRVIIILHCDDNSKKTADFRQNESPDILSVNQLRNNELATFMLVAENKLNC